MWQRIRIAFVAGSVFALIPPAWAADQVVYFRCVQDSSDVHYEIQPNPVVVAAGTDRIEFRTGPYDEAVPCAAETNAPVLEVSIAGLPGTVSLWYSDTVAPPLGPFCESGPRTYDVSLRGSHGELGGTLGETGHIVVMPQVGISSPAGVVIGLFAEPEALHCVLPGGMGAHRAYVCARPAGAAGAVIGADFRVEGFPAGVNARAAFNSTYGLWEGDPMGAGAQLRAYCGIPPADVVVLCEIQYDVAAPLGPTAVQVATRQLPGHTSPHLGLCLDGSIAEVCAAPGRATLGGTTEACTVRLQATSWSSVRRLYR